MSGLVALIDSSVHFSALTRFSKGEISIKDNRDQEEADETRASSIVKSQHFSLLSSPYLHQLST